MYRRYCKNTQVLRGAITEDDDDDSVQESCQDLTEHSVRQSESLSDQTMFCLTEKRNLSLERSTISKRVINTSG